MKNLLTLICVVSTMGLAALRGLYFLYSGVARTLLREVMCLDEETYRKAPCQIFLQTLSITPALVGIYQCGIAYTDIDRAIAAGFDMGQAMHLCASLTIGMISYFITAIAVFAMIAFPVIAWDVLKQIASAVSGQWKQCADKVEARLHT